MQLSATAITPRVQRWLQKPKPAMMLHLFDQVINLSDADGEIISVVQSKIKPGPFSLLIAEERPFPTLIHPHATVAKTKTSLIIGPLEIVHRAAKLWHPIPDWQRLQERQAEWLWSLDEMQTAINKRLDYLGAIGPANFANLFQATIAELLAVKFETDPVAWQTAVAKLAGFGPGFTPAGDDFLVGFLFGLWATRPAAEAAKMAKVVVETAVPRTTQLSAAWLQAAGRGEAVEPWHELVNALLTHADWQLPLQKILRTGTTSGVAAVMGFVTAVANAAR
ncbi:MAG: DUF2877 domain-containing protein [Anaerolineaceae bacterium]|nr:DUF2877 domain-containing protein [Anaerolineaceae bacterium]